MIGTIRAALTRPESFFESRQANPSLLYPAVIVAIIGVLGVIATIPTFLVVSRGMPAGARLFLAVGAVVGLLIGLVGPFVTWLLYAIAFQVISYFFDGKGTFRKTFILSGWGFLPQILSSVLSLIAMFVIHQNRSLPVESGPQAMQAFTQQLQAHPLLQAVGVIGIGLTLWSGYIWLFAVKYARNLSRTQALVTVAIPVLISIGISVFNLLRF